MVRKFAAALVALAIATGSIFAEEVEGLFVKFSEGTLTLKVDDKDKDYKTPTDLKIKRKGKDGTETEIAASDVLSKTKEGREVTLTVDGAKVTGVKLGKKK